MAAGRKLQAEIDKLLKKVEEGIEEFDNVWNHVHNASQPNQREKFEAELKAQIKKLQRDREQIKAWLGDKQIKDKNALTEARKKIEHEMERFKEFERDAKTKTYSKEGLSRADKADPHMEEKMGNRLWMQDCIDKMHVQIDECEADLEIQKKTKKPDESKVAGLHMVQETHRWHVTKLEQLLRKLDNDEVNFEELTALQELIEYYVDDNSHEPDEFNAFEGIYEGFKLEEVEDYLTKDKNEKMARQDSEVIEEEKELEKELDRIVEPKPPSKRTGGAIAEKDKAVVAPSTRKHAAKAEPAVEAVEEAKEKAPVQKPWPPMVSVWTNPPVSSAPQPPPAPEREKAPPPAPTAPVGPPPKPGPGQAPKLPPPTQPAPDRPPPPGQAPVLNTPTHQPPPKPAPHQPPPGPPHQPPTQAPPQPPLPAPPAGSPPRPQGAAAMPPPPSIAPPAPKDGGPLDSAAVLETTTTTAPPTSAPPPPPPPPLPPPPPAPAPAPALSLASLAPSMPSGPPPAPQPADTTTAPKVPPPSEAPPPPAEVPPPPPPIEPSVGGVTKRAQVTLDGGAATESDDLETLVAAAMAGSIAPGETSTMVLRSLPSAADGQEQACQWLDSNGFSGCYDFLLYIPGKRSRAKGSGSCAIVNFIGGAASEVAVSLEDISVSASSIQGLVALLDHFGNYADTAKQQTMPSAFTAGNSSSSTAMAGGLGGSFEGGLGLGQGAAGSQADAVATAGLPDATGNLSPRRLQSLSLLSASHRNRPLPSDSRRNRKYVPRSPYVHLDTRQSAAYPMQPTRNYDDPAMFEKYDLDTLFFIFYYQQGSYQQHLAAKELKKLSWRYHTKYLTWFQRHEEPRMTASDFERGAYVYFDHDAGWCQRIKSDFTFEYQFLEDEPM